MPIVIPTWQEATLPAKHERTALERFIYENEPGGLVETENFRKDLQAVLQGMNGDEPVFLSEDINK